MESHKGFNDVLCYERWKPKILTISVRQSVLAVTLYLAYLGFNTKILVSLEWVTT